MLVSRTQVALLAATLFMVGCGNDDNVTVNASNAGVLRGTVTYPPGGSATAAIVAVLPRQQADSSAANATAQQLQAQNQTYIANGQLRIKQYPTQGVNSFTYEFRDLPAGEYAVLIRPTNITGNGTATESNVLASTVRATTDVSNSSVQLNATTTASTSLTTTANPPSGNAPTVTFTQNLIGFTDNAPVGDPVVGTFILVPENSDRIFDLSYRTSTGPISTFSATFNQDNNWGAAGTRTLCYSLNEPDTLPTNLVPGSSRSVTAVYTYQR